MNRRHGLSALLLGSLQATPTAPLAYESAAGRVAPERSRIRHGLDSWDTLHALSTAVQGNSPAGSAPIGKVELIGATFDVTPGMFRETYLDGSPSPVAQIQFPCTLKALDPYQPPVFRSTSGERDVLQIHASLLAPIAGEVCLQDLVIRDNRAAYNSGEAGVRIKDRFPGRTIKLERCQILRCQNAVAGGGLGQALRIQDCRIMDCGFGEQAHGLYVQVETLEFFGNHIAFTPGNELAKAHMLKSRALVTRIWGNRFDMADCPASYLVDAPNGGDVDIVGNLMRYGARSDNSSATFIAYAAEGAAGDGPSRGPQFALGRGFKLRVRNNTLVSDFEGPTQFVVVNQFRAAGAGGAILDTMPLPLQVADNVLRFRGSAVVAQHRDHRGHPSRVGAIDTPQQSAASVSTRPSFDPHEVAAARSLQPNNLAGLIKARSFSGHTALGTGSREFEFTRRGA